MSQNPFFGSSDSQTFMSHSFIPALIYGLKVFDQQDAYGKLSIWTVTTV